jgi:AcrR family transcriptional regulator
MGQMTTEQKRGRGRPVNEARREEIIATAGRLFGELGLHATTMEHIAKELKISKITLYSRFADKDELFTAVIQAKCQQHIPDQFYQTLTSLRGSPAS